MTEAEYLRTKVEELQGRIDALEDTLHRAGELADELTGKLNPFIQYAVNRLAIFGENNSNSYLTTTVVSGRVTAQLLPEDWKNLLK